MTRYGQSQTVPQTVQQDPRQVPNSAGGFSFKLSKWDALDRFLILGTEGGTYYATERKLTLANLHNLKACIAEDGLRVVERAHDISKNGLAHKNDPAIFALAATHNLSKAGDVREAARAAIPVVCRTGTHLLHFVADVDGWGRGLRTAVGRWFTEKPAEHAAFQIAKYNNRDGWRMRDVLRLAHPFPPTIEHHALFRTVVGGGTAAMALQTKRGAPIHPKYGPELFAVIEALHANHDDVKAAVQVIASHRLTHEMIPNELKSHPEVWEAMLPTMGAMATIRNLGKMTAVGLLKPMSAASRVVVDRLASEDTIRGARLHPMSVLISLHQYKQGHGLKGKLSWDPNGRIVDVLDAAFYLAFGNVTPSGKRHMLALDISGSMGSAMMGTPLSARAASAAMAMITARTERDYTVMGFGSTFHELPISPRQRLDDIVKTISGLDFDTTDCSLPMLYALQKKIPVDVFVVYTDSETYHGKMHPHEALDVYRRKMGIAAKLVVVGMAATDFTIADPTDAGMLDVVGFSSDTPSAISLFTRDHVVENSVENQNDDLTVEES